ncbi:MAG TPA: hypothetical protein VKV25_10965, partial [Acidimicrobiales bacterium]|nr:hypothetical protein [Acidimicrobiales bacterium]
MLNWSDRPAPGRRSLGRRRLLVAATGVSALGLLALQAAPAGAAPPRVHATPVGTAGRAAGDHSAGRVVGRLAAPLSGGGYLYAEDGTCPDGITVYQVTGRTLTQVEQVSVGCSNGTYFGNHHLAVTAVGGTDCLVFSDDGDGLVDSFAIAANGQIPTTPTSSVTVGGRPGDLAVNGSAVYESNVDAGTIDAFTLGSGCTMTLDSQNSTNGETDYNIGVARGDVVSADNNTGDLVAYAPQDNGTLEQTVTAPGQIAEPGGIAVLSKGAATNVYTGQTTLSPPQAQGEHFTGTSFSPAGVATDTSSGVGDGASVAGS